MGSLFCLLLVLGCFLCFFLVQKLFDIGAVTGFSVTQPEFFGIFPQKFFDGLFRFFKSRSGIHETAYNAVLFCSRRSEETADDSLLMFAEKTADSCIPLLKYHLNSFKVFKLRPLKKSFSFSYYIEEGRDTG